MSETVLGERPAEASSTGGPRAQQGNGHPGGMFRQGAAWPWTWACLRRGQGGAQSIEDCGCRPGELQGRPHATPGAWPHAARGERWERPFLVHKLLGPRPPLPPPF